jgi:hypothetical protein
MDQGASRRSLPAAVAFGGTGLAFAGVTLAAGAPTPMLAFYQHKWGFHAGCLPPQSDPAGAVTSVPDLVWDQPRPEPRAWLLAVAAAVGAAR